MADNSRQNGFLDHVYSCISSIQSGIASFFRPCEFSSERRAFMRDSALSLAALSVPAFVSGCASFVAGEDYDAQLREFNALSKTFLAEGFTEESFNRACILYHNLSNSERTVDETVVSVGELLVNFQSANQEYHKIAQIIPFWAREHVSLLESLCSGVTERGGFVKRVGSNVEFNELVDQTDAIYLQWLGEAKRNDFTNFSAFYEVFSRRMKLQNHSLPADVMEVIKNIPTHHALISKYGSIVSDCELMVEECMRDRRLSVDDTEQIMGKVSEKIKLAGGNTRDAADITGYSIGMFVLSRLTEEVLVKDTFCFDIALMSGMVNYHTHPDGSPPSQHDMYMSTRIDQGTGIVLSPSNDFIVIYGTNMGKSEELARVHRIKPGEVKNG